VRLLRAAPTPLLAAARRLRCCSFDALDARQRFDAYAADYADYFLLAILIKPAHCHTLAPLLFYDIVAAIAATPLAYADIP